jgi:hypothetical protein
MAMAMAMAMTMTMAMALAMAMAMAMAMAGVWAQPGARPEALPRRAPTFRQPTVAVF